MHVVEGDGGIFQTEDKYFMAFLIIDHAAPIRNMNFFFSLGKQMQRLVLKAFL